MIEEVGVVVAQRDNDIAVRTQIKTTCGSCQAQDNCGTGAIARALTPRDEVLSFTTDLPVQIGSRVRIGIPEEALLKASFFLYLMPLIGLLVSGLFFSWLLPQLGVNHEAWIVLATLISTFLSFVWLSGWLKSQEQQHYKPRLLGILLDEPDTVMQAKQTLN